jgi:hypothetical protein
MNKMYELTKEFNKDLVHTDYDAICKELSERTLRMKDEILVAWFAEHGFTPSKAEMVEDRSEYGKLNFTLENMKQ